MDYPHLNSLNNTFCISSMQDNTFCLFTDIPTICIVYGMKDWTDLIRDQLEAIGMTQAQLGEKLSEQKTQGGIGHWLNKKRQPPFAVLMEIADIIDLDRAALGAALMEAPAALYIAKTPFQRSILRTLELIPHENEQRFRGFLEAKLEPFLHIEKEENPIVIAPKKATSKHANRSRSHKKHDPGPPKKLIGKQ